MKMIANAVLALLIAGVIFANSPVRAGESGVDRPMVLMAAPELADPVFGQAVLLTAPLRNGMHMGIILNRRTDHALNALFPEHEVLKKLKEPVYFGGPMLTEMMVVLVSTEREPGEGALKAGGDLYLALSAALIESLLKEGPPKARYYVGGVVWQAGELAEQIKAGAWSVVDADPETIFTNDPDGLWQALRSKTVASR